MAEWEPSPVDRVEWGHRNPDGSVSGCWSYHANGAAFLSSEPCGRPMWNGAPTVHVWRRRQIGEWKAEGFVDPDTVAGTPENLRALARFLAPYRCCGNVDPAGCDSRCGWDRLGLSWDLSVMERRVREELERLEKVDG